MQQDQQHQQSFRPHLGSGLLHPALLHQPPRYAESAAQKSRGSQNLQINLQMPEVRKCFTEGCDVVGPMSKHRFCTQCRNVVDCISRDVWKQAGTNAIAQEVVNDNTEGANGIAQEGVHDNAEGANANAQAGVNVDNKAQKLAQPKVLQARQEFMKFMKCPKLARKHIDAYKTQKAIWKKERKSFTYKFPDASTL